MVLETFKKALSMSTLIEFECIEGKVDFKSQVATHL